MVDQQISSNSPKFCTGFVQCNAQNAKNVRRERTNPARIIFEMKTFGFLFQFKFSRTFSSLAGWDRHQGKLTDTTPLITRYSGSYIIKSSL